MRHIGIDISNEYFDADLGGTDIRRFENSPKGFRVFMSALPAEAYCAMEATGPYGNKLATTLAVHNIAVSVVNPLQVKRFSQSLLLRTKTDKADARMLTRYGETLPPPLWQPPPAYIDRLKQLNAAIDGKIKMRTMETNQLHAISRMAVQDAFAIRMHKNTIAFFTRNIVALERQVKEIIEKECPAMHENIQSIPGIGSRTACKIIADTNAFTTFHTAKQLASYFGVCPRTTQSGSSNPGKASMCKVGNSSTRAMLYVCSWSAKECNPACKALYIRLIAKGKPPKVALIAVVNKLLNQIIAIVQTNEKFIENYQPISRKNISIGLAS